MRNTALTRQVFSKFPRTSPENIRHEPPSTFLAPKWLCPWNLFLPAATGRSAGCRPDWGPVPTTPPAQTPPGSTPPPWPPRGRAKTLRTRMVSRSIAPMWRPRSSLL